MAIRFGKWEIKDYEIFWKGAYAYAMVNTRPIVKNHVLVTSLRIVPSFCDLNTDEIAEMSFVVAKITKALGSCSVAIQDGREAGQTVPHVHFHIVPRPQEGLKQVDSLNADRSAEEMAEESAYLKKLIDSII